MYIEDLIKTLSNIGGTNRFDKQVVSSLDFQVNIGFNSFTEKQSQLAVKILKRYVDKLNQYYQKDVSQFIDFPTYKFPVRASVLARFHVSIIDHPVWSKAIKVEFPYDEALVGFIRERKTQLGNFDYALWDKDQKAWLFTLSEATIKVVMDITEKKNFSCDEEFSKYAKSFQQIVMDMENIMPMLVVEGGTPKFKNIPSQIPELETTDLLKSVFEARKVGISVWDDTVEKFLQSENIDPLVLKFVKSDPSDYFKVDSNSTDIFCLKDIVKNLEPAIFIIPGGLELENLQKSYEFLKNIGVDDEEISVMFRLPNDTSKNFNEFVKNNKLNNPISKKTRYVFISTRLPKTVVGSEINFYSIISLAEHFTHHTLRDFSKGCQNFIYFCQLAKNKGSHFASL